MNIESFKQVNKDHLRLVKASRLKTKFQFGDREDYDPEYFEDEEEMYQFELEELVHLANVLAPIPPTNISSCHVELKEGIDTPLLYQLFGIDEVIVVHYKNDSYFHINVVSPHNQLKITGHEGKPLPVSSTHTIESATDLVEFFEEEFDEYYTHSDITDSTLEAFEYNLAEESLFGVRMHIPTKYIQELRERESEQDIYELLIDYDKQFDTHYATVGEAIKAMGDFIQRLEKYIPFH